MSVPKRLLAVSIGAALSLSSTLPTLHSMSLAESAQMYVPPPGRSRRAQRSEGVGSRGCTEAIHVSLTLLIPNDHVPTTVSGRPTFLWHVSNITSAPLRFTLVEPGVSEPIMDKRLKVEKPGIIQMQMPPDVPELVEGKEYRWTVSIICNERRPSENIYARAWIQRVPKTPDLVQKLAAVNLARERAGIYARSGVWYDAISELYKAYTDSPEERIASEYFWGLLEQVGLSKITAQELQRISFRRQKAVGRRQKDTPQINPGD